MLGDTTYSSHSIKSNPQKFLHHESHKIDLTLQWEASSDIMVSSDLGLCHIKIPPNSSCISFLFCNKM
jgi:hypothetical protein